MVLLEFSMSPLDKGESLGKYVAKIIDVIDSSGVDYRLNPMGTVLEGEYDQVMAVVKSCFERLKKESNRISVSIKIDYRNIPESRIQKKIDRIETELNKKIKQ